MNILDLVGREAALFDADMAAQAAPLSEAVAAARFLVIGGAGSIGQAVTREIFKRNPRALHVVDIFNTLHADRTRHNADLSDSLWPHERLVNVPSRPVA